MHRPSYRSRLTYILLQQHLMHLSQIYFPVLQLFYKYAEERSHPTIADQQFFTRPGLSLSTRQTREARPFFPTYSTVEPTRVTVLLVNHFIQPVIFANEALQYVDEALSIVKTGKQSCANWYHLNGTPSFLLLSSPNNTAAKQVRQETTFFSPFFPSTFKFIDSHLHLF